MFYGPLLAGNATDGTIDPLSDVILDDDQLEVQIGNRPEVLRVDRPQRCGAHAPAPSLRAKAIPQGHPVKNASLDPFTPAKRVRTKQLRRPGQPLERVIMPDSTSKAEEAQKVKVAANQARLLHSRAIQAAKQATRENERAVKLMAQAQEIAAKAQQACCVKKAQLVVKAQKIAAKARMHDARSKNHEATAQQFRASAAELAQRARIGAETLKTYWGN